MKPPNSPKPPAFRHPLDEQLAAESDTLNETGPDPIALEDHGPETRTTALAGQSCGRCHWG